MINLSALTRNVGSHISRSPLGARISTSANMDAIYIFSKYINADIPIDNTYK